MLLAAFIAVLVAYSFHLALTHNFGADVDPLDPTDDPFEPTPPVPLPPATPSKPLPDGDEPLEQRWSRLAPVALLVLGLLAPGIAHADTGTTAVVGGSVGGLVLLGLMTLVHATGLDMRVASWVASLKAPAITIANHPRISAGIAALEQAALHIVQDMITPALLADLEVQLQTKSLAMVGAYMLATYSPQLLARLEARAKELAGEELDVLFGDSALKAQTAALKLGEAASTVVATAKMVRALPSGVGVIVAPAGA